MREPIYDDAHVALSRRLGRLYNNPLGDRAFPLLRHLLGAGHAPPQVLDAGCGRGRTALWWAQHGARVTAFDPSPAMLREAEVLLRDAGLSDAVSLRCADIRGFQPDRPFDLVLLHDVLCYSDDQDRDLQHLAACCRPEGLLSLTDYFGEAGAPEVRDVASAWGIRPPPSFERHFRRLRELPVEILLLVDTTRQYAEHWLEIRRRVERERSRLVDEVGTAAVDRLDEQIGAIETAVQSRRFGHLWAIVERRRGEVAHA
ncbi:MAG: class I SAM-dependent methyltransferase [Myxococcales bacterium]|nr:class I SAM-dependent methyltransferase [Myxococcales bacterium]